MFRESTVFVVDDDDLGRKSVCALVQSMGVKAESFASAEEFLDKYTDDRPGCVVTDLRMHGMSGVELQEKLGQRGNSLPVIILTAFARTSVTVRAIQAGAVTVLDKPCEDDDLWNAIRGALAKGKAAQEEHAQSREICARLAKLTPQERQILDMTVDGAAVKSIAAKLGISERTVATRRRKLLAKMQADSIADLIRLATLAGGANNLAQLGAAAGRGLNAGG
jgi:RNA polymerase sigma factor (sigma-70 family)